MLYTLQKTYTQSKNIAVCSMHITIVYTVMNNFIAYKTSWLAKHASSIICHAIVHSISMNYWMLARECTCFWFNQWVAMLSFHRSWPIFIIKNYNNHMMRKVIIMEVVNYSPWLPVFTCSYFSQHNHCTFSNFARLLDSLIASYVLVYQYDFINTQ